MELTTASKRGMKQSGFTMLELMVSLVVLSLVMGVVVQGLVGLEQRNKIETQKVDLTQEARQFEDQIVNDIHQAGFPSLKMFDAALWPANQTTCDNTKVNVACGFISATPSSLQFEADVDGTGVNGNSVSEVFIQLNPLNGPCPCVIQRGTVPKAVWVVNQQPPFYYTEVTNVVNTNIFQGYDKSGNNVALNGAPPLNLAAIEITLNVRSQQSDSNGIFPTITMSTGAKIANVN